MPTAAPPRAARSGAQPVRRPARRFRAPDPKRRLQAILILSLIVLSLVAGRLVQLQGLDRSNYAAMAERQRLHTVGLTAPRGDIVDRDGRPLAETVDARDVYADPTKVTDPAVEAEQLAPVLGLPVRALRDLLSKRTTFVYLSRAVTPGLAATVMDLHMPGNGHPQLPGIGVL